MLCKVTASVQMHKPVSSLGQTSMQETDNLSGKVASQLANQPTRRPGSVEETWFERSFDHM
jgi:hypothetical protein